MHAQIKRDDQFKNLPHSRKARILKAVKRSYKKACRERQKVLTTTQKGGALVAEKRRRIELKRGLMNVAIWVDKQTHGNAEFRPASQYADVREFGQQPMRMTLVD